MWEGAFWNFGLGPSGIVSEKYIGIVAWSFIIVKFLSGGKHLAVIGICWASACIGAHRSFFQDIGELCCNIHKMLSCRWIELFWHFWKKLKSVETVTNYHGTFFLIIHKMIPALRWPGLKFYKLLLIPDKKCTQNRPSMKIRTVDAQWIITRWIDRNPWKYDMPVWTWMSSLLPQLLNCMARVRS